MPQGQIAWNKGKTKELYPQLSNGGNKRGYVPWNKGLTKETDLRVQMNAEQISRTWYESFELKRTNMRKGWVRLLSRGFIRTSEARDASRRGGINSMKKQSGWRFISKGQKNLFDRLSCGNPNLVMEHKVICGEQTFFLDIADVNMKIDIEYDGSYWHSRRKEADSKRDLVLKSLGWSVVRIDESKMKEFSCANKMQLKGV